MPFIYTQTKIIRIFSKILQIKDIFFYITVICNYYLHLELRFNITLKMLINSFILLNICQIFENSMVFVIIVDIAHKQALQLNIQMQYKRVRINLC